MDNPEKLATGSGENTKIRQPMLKLKAHSGFHDLVLNFWLVDYCLAFIEQFFQLYSVGK